MEGDKEAEEGTFFSGVVITTITIIVLSIIITAKDTTLNITIITTINPTVVPTIPITTTSKTQGSTGRLHISAPCQLFFHPADTDLATPGQREHCLHDPSFQ